MTETVKERLEYLRSQIEAENISYGEIYELQTLAPHIDPFDVQLLEWAGVPEFPEVGICDTCSAEYPLAERSVTGGRTIRCGDCGNCSLHCPPEHPRRDDSLLDESAGY